MGYKEIQDTWQDAVAVNACLLKALGLPHCVRPVLSLQALP